MFANNSRAIFPKTIKDVDIAKLFENRLALFLAPMEDVTDLAFREICRQHGADMVFTEFVNSDGLVRGDKRGLQKMSIVEKERPVGIQIYGNDIDNMVRSAIMAEKNNPDVIDVNAGCWVKKVSKRGAGAGLLKDPDHMQKMIGKVVKGVKKPVSVKTRIGWCQDSIHIVEIAKRLEDVGVAFLTLHCRTREQAHRGEADWSWIEKVKNEVSMPVVLNGGVMSANDAKRALDTTPADGLMIARGAIGKPWVFSEIKHFLETGKPIEPTPIKKRIEICIEHLSKSIELKGERRGIPAFRKFYGGYFRDIAFISELRNKLMQCSTFVEVKQVLGDFQKVADLPKTDLEMIAKNEG